MVRLAASLAILLLGVLPSVAACPRQEVSGPQTWKRVNPVYARWLQNQLQPSDQWSWQRKAILGDGIRLPIRYVFTHQGNGTIKIANLELRVWRAHAGEGFTFSPNWLGVRIYPGAQGCTLAVRGRIQKLDEESDIPAGAPIPVRLNYVFDQATHRFHRVTGRSAEAIADIDLSGN